MLTATLRAAAAMLLGTLPGCGRAEPVEIDAAADGTTIRLAPGATLRLTLAENPSTGFRWRLIADGAPVLQASGDAYTSSGTMPGAPGLHRWEFRAAQPGEAPLRLEHLRPWEKVPPVESFAVAIRVAG